MTHVPFLFCSPQSYYLGHLSDIYRVQKESGNDEVPFSVVLQQW